MPFQRTAKKKALAIIPLHAIMVEKICKAVTKKLKYNHWGKARKSQIHPFTTAN